jgi:hypothetical protein
MRASCKEGYALLVRPGPQASLRGAEVCRRRALAWHRGPANSQQLVVARSAGVQERLLN